MTDLDITIKPTRYTVSALSEDDVNSRHWTIAVEYRGNGKWAVMHLGWCLGADGEWDFESIPSEREDEWLETHRFDRDEALELAKKAMPELNVNGLTLSRYLARKAARQVEGSAR